MAMRFDPFSDRLSRDIRNSLSSSFSDSLEKMDPTLFREAARGFLKRDLAGTYTAYIEDRLKLYEEVFSQIRQKGVTDGFAKGLVTWNHGLFFETHEFLESVWHKSSGEMRKAIKGMIQAAAAYVHMQENREAAARTLASKAASLLREHGHSLGPFPNLPNLLEKLEKADPVPPKL